MAAVPEPLATIEFGRFKIVRHRRELLDEAGRSSWAGARSTRSWPSSRARGTVLAKDELMSRVWPDRVVEEHNLHAQISLLRKALGDDRRLFQTVAGPCACRRRARARRAN
jgi:DNA-binding response OmpR family regulator